jgi:hypothetical protein
MPFFDQLKGRGKRRGRRRAPFDRVQFPPFGQVRQDVRPTACIADQTTHAFQRLFHRKHRIAIHHKGAEFVTCPDARITLHQIKQGRGIGNFAHPRHHFGLAARKEITPQPIPRHQTRCGIAHRLQPFQLKRKMCGQFLARRPLFGWIGRQEKTGFEKSKPCGHHQIVRRQFKAQRLGLFHKGQVLARQLQNGNLAQVHFLGTAERQ